MGFGASGGGGGTLSGSGDVALNNPSDSEFLGYNSTTNKWTNVSAPTVGATDGVPPAYKVVASNDAPASVKAAADFVCDGTADEVQINQAIAASSSDSINLGGQGGSVLLWGRLFTTNGPILMRSQVTLKGLGQFATTIKPATSYQPGEDGGVIELYSGNTQYSTVDSLAIHGNGWDASASSCGIYYLQGEGSQWDASHRLTNLYIYATAWHGIRIRGGSNSRARAAYLSNIRIIDAGTTVNSTACGLWVQDHVDSFFFGIDVGSSASHGIRVSGANNRFIGCKSWFSGSLASGAHQGSGFYIETVRNQLTACEAQDNYGDGYFIGSGDTSLSACVADSNGYNRNGGGTGGWTGSGFYISSQRVTLQGNAYDKNEGGRGLYQKHAVVVSSSSLNKLLVQVVSGNSGLSSLGGTIHADSVVTVL